MKKIIYLLLLANLAYAGEKTLTGFQAIGAPYASYKEGEGYAGGFGLLLYNYGDGKISPYNWNIYLDVRASTEGQQIYKIQANAPHIFGSNLRLFLDLGYRKYLYEDYYGMGNQTAYHPEYADKNDPQFLSETFYSFFSESPYANVDLQIPTRFANAYLIAGAGMQKRRLTFYDDEPNKLAADKPFGIDGGWTNFWRCGLVWDSRDNEAVTKKGAWSEILFHHHASILQSDYDFKRLSIIDRRYFSISKRLVYAQRLLAEHLFGRVPFYETMQIYTYSQRMYGVGGSDSMRGIPRLLFLGDSKFISNFELRYELFHITLLNQPFTVFTHAFVDAGKVWQQHDPAALQHLHFSQGVGVHVLWKKDAVFALDIGRSPYLDHAVYIGFGNLF